LEATDRVFEDRQHQCFLGREVTVAARAVEELLGQYDVRAEEIAQAVAHGQATRFGFGHHVERRSLTGLAFHHCRVSFYPVVRPMIGRWRRQQTTGQKRLSVTSTQMRDLRRPFASHSILQRYKVDT
jgi:hypothetical protein